MRTTRHRDLGMAEHGILLVHAPAKDPGALFRGAPMSILYAAAVVADRLSRGVYSGLTSAHLSLFDCTEHSADPSRALADLRGILESKHPRVVAIGCASYGYYWAIQLALTVKQWNAATVVILGGPHEDEAGAEGVGGSISDHADVFDFSIQGDAEYLFAFLIEQLCKATFDIQKAKQSLSVSGALQDVVGQCRVTFRCGERIVSVSPTGRFRAGLRQRGSRPINLARLPPAPRWLLSPSAEMSFGVFCHPDRSPKRVAQLMAARGCNFACSFCTERGAYTDRPAEHVFEEIERLNHEGYEAFFFDDSTLHLYRDLPNLINALAALKAETDAEFGGLSRVDTLLHYEDHLPLALFEQAGFSYFYVGLEHVDDMVLGELNKGYSADDAHACFDLIRATRLRAGVSLLFGAKSETTASQRKSLRFVAEREEIVLVSLSVIAFHPASDRKSGSSEQLRFDREAPNPDREWLLFEEGPWFHPDRVDLEYVRRLHGTICEIDAETGGRLLPKLQRRDQVILPGNYFCSDDLSPGGDRSIAGSHI